MNEKELRIDNLIDDKIEFSGNYKRFMLSEDKEYRSSLFSFFRRKAKEGRSKETPRESRHKTFRDTAKKRT